MNVCTHTGTLSWDTPVWDPGLDYDRDLRRDITAHVIRLRYCISRVRLTFRLHETSARGYPCDRRYMHIFIAWLRRRRS